MHSLILLACALVDTPSQVPVPGDDVEFRIYVHICMCVRACVRAFLRVRVRARVYVCACVILCVRVCLCVRAFGCVCVRLVVCALTDAHLHAVFILMFGCPSSIDTLLHSRCRPWVRASSFIHVYLYVRVCVFAHVRVRVRACVYMCD